MMVQYKFTVQYLLVLSLGAALNRIVGQTQSDDVELDNLIADLLRFHENNSPGPQYRPQHDFQHRHPPTLPFEQSKPPLNQGKIKRRRKKPVENTDWWDKLFDFKCGQRFLPKQQRGDSSSSYRFVAGGHTANLYNYPSYMKLTTKRNDNSIYGCGGTLISRQFILTARHCVNGDVNQVYAQSTIHRHPKSSTKMYAKTICNLDDGESDVSLIKLNRPVTFSATLQPACLPDVPLTGSTQAVSVGLGASDITGNYFTYPLQLKAIPMVRVLCDEVDMSLVNICFSPNIKKYYGDTCVGDSGGPTYAQVDGRQVVYGVTSTGYTSTCHEGTIGYGIYGDVYNLKNRIIRTMQNCE